MRPDVQSARILIVEDEPAVAELVIVNLRNRGLAPVWAHDAEAAQCEIEAAIPDAVVLDWMLPDLSGLDLARRWRAGEAMKDVPILMLTARGCEADKITALEAGVDDYVTKPFSPGELVARVRAVLRRSHPPGRESVLRLGALVLDDASHRVQWNGRTLRMGPTEFRLLHFLLQHPERVHSRQQLVASVWGFEVVLEQRTVDVHIKRLREALGPARTLLETVRGAGYRLTAEPAREGT